MQVGLLISVRPYNLRWIFILASKSRWSVCQESVDGPRGRIFRLITVKSIPGLAYAGLSVCLSVCYSEIR